MELFYVFIGWVLGVISPLITDNFSVHLQKKQVRKGILAELNDVRERLDFLSFKMTSKFGILDTSFLEWLKGQLRTKEANDRMHEEFRIVLKDLIDDQNKRQSFVDSKKNENRNAIFSSRYSMPFVESKLSFVEHFEVSFSRKILEIVGYLNYLNEIIDESRWYFRKTFDKNIDEKNSKIIHANLDRSYAIIGDRAKEVATEISKLVSI